MNCEDSPNCQACELYKQCKSQLRPVVDMRPDTQNTNCMLIVGDYADGPDDQHGRYFNSNGRGYKYIENILPDLECRYVFTTALACGIPHPKTTKLGVKQFRACFEEKLKPLIIKHKPRVIVFLGTQAMKAGLGANAPKSLKSITQTGMNLTWNEGTDEEINSLILAIDHPSMFNMERTDVNRLEKLYHAVFTKAEKYCLNTDVRLPVEYELIDNPARLYAVAGLPFVEMAFDIENTHSDKDINKNTLWKKDTRILSLAITYYEERVGEYRNFVVVGNALKDKICLEKLFRDRHVVAHNCLVGDSLVKLADGSMITLSKMCKEKHEGPVLTLNEITGKVEAKKVVGWVNNPARDWADWLRINVTGRGLLSLTKDHEVLTTRGRVRAEDLVLGDRIYSHKKELSPQQKSLLIGSLMGDACLVKDKRALSNYFIVSHGEKQHEYLDFKVKVLGSFVNAVKINKPTSRGFSKNTILKSLRTKADQRIDDLVKNAPLRKKELSTLDLEWLKNPATLAVWFMDDGNRSKRGTRISICVSAYKAFDSYKALVIGLNNAGYTDVKMYVRPDGHIYLYMSGETSKKFLTDIAPYVPECMNYKLTEDLRGCYNPLLWESTEQSAWSDEVVSIEPLLKKVGSSRYSGRAGRGIGPRQYCLEVEDNHNFFAGELCVSNCRHDAQGMWTLCGIDIFKLVKDYDDTLALFYLSDQNRLDNGLKPLAAQYLGIHDYVDEVKQHVAEANRRIKELRKDLTAQIKEKKKHLGWFLEGFKHHAGQIKCTKDKLKKLEEIILRYKSYDNLKELIDHLEKQLAEVPIEGSADYGDIPIAVLASYNAEDTLSTLRLKREILPYLSKHDKSFNQQDPLWTEEAYNLYKRSVRMSCYVERNGLPMDMASLDEMNIELIQKEKELRESMLSHPEVQKAILGIEQIAVRQSKGTLTDEIMLKELSPTKAKFMTNLCKNLNLQEFACLTKGGNWSYTSKKCVQSIREHYDAIGNEDLGKLFRDFVYIGNNRQVRSKFIKNWKTFYVPEDGCFHPRFLLTKNNNIMKGGHSEGANGRTSSSEINTQQIRKVAYLRKHFKAPPGYIFVEIDYSALEPVLISFLTNCERLKEVFRRGLDIYLVTANDIYGPWVDMSGPDLEVKRLLKEYVDETFRNKLKIGFLAWCYGRGKASFARDMKISEEDTDAFYAKALEMYGEVYAWKEGIKETLENGEVLMTMFGRKRSFPVRPAAYGDRDDFYRHRKEFAKAMRVAVNFPVQSLGSDICLWQASHLNEWIQRENLENVIKIVNLVHDAVWLLVKESQADWAIPACQAIMEDVSQLPFTVDVPLRTAEDHGPTLASYLKKGKEQTELPY